MQNKYDLNTYLNTLFSSVRLTRKDFLDPKGVTGAIIGEAFEHLNASMETPFPVSGRMLNTIDQLQSKHLPPEAFRKAFGEIIMLPFHTQSLPFEISPEARERGKKTRGEVFTTRLEAIEKRYEIHTRLPARATVIDAIYTQLNITDLLATKAAYKPTGHTAELTATNNQKLEALREHITVNNVMQAFEKASDTLGFPLPISEQAAAEIVDAVNHPDIVLSTASSKLKETIGLSLTSATHAHGQTDYSALEDFEVRRHNAKAVKVSQPLGAQITDIASIVFWAGSAKRAVLDNVAEGQLPLFKTTEATLNTKLMPHIQQLEDLIATPAIHPKMPRRTRTQWSKEEIDLFDTTLNTLAENHPSILATLEKFNVAMGKPIVESHTDELGETYVTRRQPNRIDPIEYGDSSEEKARQEFQAQGYGFGTPIPKSPIAKNIIRNMPTPEFLKQTGEQLIDGHLSPVGGSPETGLGPQKGGRT